MSASQDSPGGSMQTLTEGPQTKRRLVRAFEEGHRQLKGLLGGKGAQLAEMTSLGLPVPHGFTITTEACLDYYRNGRRYPDDLWPQVVSAVRDLEASTGLKLGDPSNPLLVSVRSGAAISMPGMMDTILDLGIGQEVANGIARSTGNERFALDLYRRFIQMFGNVTMGIDLQSFEEVMEEQQRIAGVGRSADLSPASLRTIVAAFKEIVRESSGQDVPEDPLVQLDRSVRAVFESWNSRRAVAYRTHHRIPHDLGTAVNIVAMVYGNIDDNSCTGVLFTRSPSTGERVLFGEYLFNAQGEDLVSGMATPRDISGLAEEMPDIYDELVRTADKLERHYRDTQDVEFTVQQGKLHILQTRTGKRSARAAVAIAVDMAEEGLITREEALLRVEPEQIYQLLLPKFEDAAKEKAAEEGRYLASGLGASPGGATGKVVFDADTAVQMGEQGAVVILARSETSAEDVHGMMASAGVLTSRGGATSHAAVVGRGLGKPCVVGAETIEVSTRDGYLRAGEVTVEEGSEISIDGTTGEVFLGAISTIHPEVDEEEALGTLLGWADSARRLGVWANADYPSDARTARRFGAEGIGLCRTEHMFFEPERLSLVREMIVAAHRSIQDPQDQETQDTFRRTLERLGKLQVSDFEGLFREMEGHPVVIRLLDPPLHEFLPSHEELSAEVSEAVAGSARRAEREALLATVDDMRETNPMLGMRGCRVGMTFPAIYEMQARSILEAAQNVAAEGVEVRPEIMVPLVSHGNEMRSIRHMLEEALAQAGRGVGDRVSCKIGTMIETPRAAITADEIAESAEFFSFGTNDLTQMTYAFSRDDAEGKFLLRYVEQGVLADNPFQSVDRSGVGRLVETACELGRQARADIVIGICGEHGGDPASIEFFHETGLDYVSCSPYRVPVARLAAAQAAIRSGHQSPRE